MPFLSAVSNDFFQAKTVESEVDSTSPHPKPVLVEFLSIWDEFQSCFGLKIIEFGPRTKFGRDLGSMQIQALVNGGRRQV